MQREKSRKMSQKIDQLMLTQTSNGPRTNSALTSLAEVERQVTHSFLKNKYWFGNTMQALERNRKLDADVQALKASLVNVSLALSGDVLVNARVDITFNFYQTFFSRKNTNHF